MPKKESNKKTDVSKVAPGTLLLDGEVLDPNELIAVEYYQTIPKIVKVQSREYVFSVQHNVCLGWVRREDVPVILAMKGGCCGNQKPGVFKLASELNIRIWKTGDR